MKTDKQIIVTLFQWIKNELDSYTVYEQSEVLKTVDFNTWLVYRDERKRIVRRIDNYLSEFIQTKYVNAYRTGDGETRRKIGSDILKLIRS